MSRFINTELKLDSDSGSGSDLSDSDLDSKFDNELMARLKKSGSDSE